MSLQEKLVGIIAPVLKDTSGVPYRVTKLDEKNKHPNATAIIYPFDKEEAKEFQNAAVGDYPKPSERSELTKFCYNTIKYVINEGIKKQEIGAIIVVINSKERFGPQEVKNLQNYGIQGVQCLTAERKTILLGSNHFLGADRIKKDLKTKNIYVTTSNEDALMLLERLSNINTIIVTYTKKSLEDIAIFEPNYN